MTNKKVFLMMKQTPNITNKKMIMKSPNRPIENPHPPPSSGVQNKKFYDK